MLIFIDSEMHVLNPTDRLKRWCKDFLTVSNPEYSKKLRMGFWVGNTPPTLSLYESRGEDLWIPYGAMSLIPKDILDEGICITEFDLGEDVQFDADVPLYDYQKKAVSAMVDAGYGILQSPAGSGKTQMGLAIAAKLGKKTLWLCHTLDLVKQSRDRALMYMSPDKIGTISAGKVDIGNVITFATIQSMSKLYLNKYKNVWDVIITDEVHRVSGTPTAITQYEKVLNRLCAKHKYGLSATVHRSDGMIKATYALVGKVMYNVSEEDVADKIMKVGVIPLGTEVKMSDEALNYDGTLNYAKFITYLTHESTRNKVILTWLINHQQYSSLILSDRLDHLQTLMRMLPDSMLERSVMISGRMTSKAGKKDRQQAIEDMRSGKKKYLFATYSLAKEGLDIPCLERLYLTTPQKDYAIVAQSVGRIARVSKGKADPVVYDFVDDIGYAVKAYKKRCTTYRKLGAHFMDADDEGRESCRS